MEYTIPAYERRWGNDDLASGSTNTLTPTPFTLDPPPFIYLADPVFDISDFTGRITVIGDEAYEINGDGNSVTGDELIVHDQQSGAKSVSLSSRTDANGNTIYGISGLIKIGIGSENPESFFGIEYEMLEQVELRLGDLADTVSIDAMPAGTVAELVLGDGDDTVQVNALGGGVRILGGGGSDTVNTTEAIVSQANLGTEFSFEGDLHRREEILTRLKTDPDPDYSDQLNNSTLVYVNSENDTSANSDAVAWPDAFGPTGSDLPSAGNEQQRIASDATGGTFKLAYQGVATGDIAYNASASVIGGALNGLGNIPSGNLIVTLVAGQTQAWTVEFGGTWAGTNRDQLVGDFSGLTVDPPATLSASVTTTFDVAKTAGFTYAPEQQDKLIYTVGDEIWINGAIVTSNGRIAEDLVQERGVWELGVQETNLGGQPLYWQTDGSKGTTLTAAPSYVTDMDTGVPLYLRQWELADSTTILIKTADPTQAKRADFSSTSIDFQGTSGTFGLRAFNNQFLSSTGTSNASVNANRDTVSSDAKFTIEVIEKNIVSLNVSGKYVSANVDGTVTADSTNVATGETFELISLGHGRAAFRTNDGIHYLSMASDGTINAASTTVSDGEIFQLVDVALQGSSSNRMGQFSGIVGEYGTVTGLSQDAQTITLKNSFVNPVVIPGPLTQSGADAAVVRISDVITTRDTQTGETITSFMIQIDESSNLDNIHTTETVSYFVVEAGRHVLEDGTVIEAGTHNTGNFAQGAGFEGIQFATPFTSTPAVFSQVQTVSGSNVQVSSDFTPNDDTYGRHGSGSTNYGSESHVLVKKTSGGDGSSTRKGIIEFPYHVATGVTLVDQALLFDVSTFTVGKDSDFYVWGLKDGISLENLNESTATYDTYKPPFDGSGDGTNNSLNYLFDGDTSSGGSAQQLGTFKASSSDLYQTVGFVDSDLDRFLNADTNGRVTILLTRGTNDGDIDSGFASKENSSLNPPRLHVEYQDIGSQYVHARQTNIGNSGFSVALEGNEITYTNQALDGVETIGWLAVDSSQSTLFAGKTGTSVNENWFTQSFAAAGFTSTPNLIANLATYNGADPTALRYRNLDNNSVEFLAQEDLFSDTEVGHGAEVVDYLLLPSGTGTIGGLPLKSYIVSSDPVANPGNLLWRDEGANWVDYADGFHPFPSYGINASGVPEIHYAPEPSLVEVTRSVAQPLNYSLVTEITDASGTDSLLIAGSTGSGDSAGALTDSALELYGVDSSGMPVFGVTGNITGVESIDITLGSGDDTFDATTYTGSLTIDGGAGNDTLMGGTGSDTILGGSGNDVLFGGLGDDTIHGDAGDDYVEGGGGNDTIVGGLGQDDLIGGNSSQFGLTSAADRPDGSDLIYGGYEEIAARNDLGNLDADGHAEDADVIIGDNGNIIRLVDTNTGQYLSYQYDNYGSEKIVPRTVELLDAAIGGSDLIYAGAGDDQVYGQTGDDTIYGEGQDDDLIGGDGSDIIYGGAGEDGIAGDSGRFATSRNGLSEPLSDVTSPRNVETLEITGYNTGAVEYLDGRLTKDFISSTFTVGASDIIFGGLGDDFIHAGAGDDAISGAEALEAFYNDPSQLDTSALAIDLTTGLFVGFDANNPLAKIDGFLLNFDATDNQGNLIEDGKDRIFGDDGSDWIVGGTGDDRLFGGMGNDVLNADDNLNTNGGLNDTLEDSGLSHADFAFGGGGQDILIANTGADRLIDWRGDFDAFVAPFVTASPTVIRDWSADTEQFIRDLGRTSGADQSLTEPGGELGLVTPIDGTLWDAQSGTPLVVNNNPTLTAASAGGLEDDRAVTPTDAGSTPGDVTFTVLAGTVSNADSFGSTVWLDVDGDGLLDPNEPRSLSNIEGQFELLVPENVDLGAALIRAQNGIDVGTGELLVTTLTASPAVDEDVTPLTTFAQHLTEAGVGETAARLLIQAVMGLDASVNIGDFDHFEEARLENPHAKNVLVAVTTIHNFAIKLHYLFSGIAGTTLDNSEVRLALSKAVYLAMADRLLHSTFDLANTEDVKGIIRNALSKLEGIAADLGLEFTVDSQRVEEVIDGVAQILVAGTVKARLLADDSASGHELVTVINQLKKQAQSIEALDLHLVGRGELSIAEAVARYGQADQAALDRIQQILLPPHMSHVPDLTTSEDKVIENVPFTVFDFETSLEQLSVTAVSDNPLLLPSESISIGLGAMPQDRWLSITPSPDQSGVATITLTVTDEAGFELSQDVIVTVYGVNDAPNPLEVGVVPVEPDPRNEKIDEITIFFSQSITGFSIEDLQLSKEGGTNLLAGSGATLNSQEGVVWTLSNLDAITSEPGQYELRLDRASAGILATSGASLTNDLTETWSNHHAADVNRSGRVTALDALNVVNYLSRQSLGSENPAADPSYHYDVNGSGHVTALDALQVINYLTHQFLTTPEAEKVSTGPATESTWVTEVVRDDSASIADQMAITFGNESERDEPFLLPDVQQKSAFRPRFNLTSSSSRSPDEWGIDSSKADPTADQALESVLNEIATDIQVEFEKLSS